jgi:alkanesulfonate monooxygenase SsuD/methylene tetrahydromethanopterin reductase-like flavin-dependent oxidoreductase (luciferase family)
LVYGSTGVLGLHRGATRRIILGTAVLQLPYNHPVTRAKRLATIDVLSRGRIRLLTVGLGSLLAEAAAVGVDYTTRGRRADEAIGLMRLLWAGDATGVRFKGDFFAFTSLVSFPKPHSNQERAHLVEVMRTVARGAGRDADGLDVTRWGSMDMSCDDVDALAMGGATRIVVSATEIDPNAQREETSAFAERHKLR